MIEFFVLLVLVLFIVYLIYSMAIFTIQFLINFALIALIIARARNDILNKEMYPYYLFSCLIVSFIFFIFSGLAEPIVNLFKKALIIKLTTALIVTLLFAYLLQYSHKRYESSKRNKK